MSQVMKKLYSEYALMILVLIMGLSFSVWAAWQQQQQMQTRVIEEFKAAAKNPYENQGFATWGEYVTPSGDYFVPVMLYVPKSAGLNGEQQVTFFGVVEDASGKFWLAVRGDGVVRLDPRTGAAEWLHHQRDLPGSPNDDRATYRQLCSRSAGDLQRA